MDIKELEKKFTELSGSIDVMKKDFELKMASAQKDAQEYKALAEKREEELRKFREETEKIKAEAEKKLAEVREKEITTFADGLKRDGRITPAQQDIIVKLMQSMTDGDTVATFKRKDGSSVSHTQLSLFKELLSGFKKQVSFGENSVAGDEDIEKTLPGDEDENAGTEQFREVLSKSGGKQRMPVKDADIAAKAEQYMEDMRKKGTPVSYTEALVAVYPKKGKKVSA